MSRKRITTEGTFHTCCHVIGWWLEGKDRKLTGDDEEHITKCIVERYNQGELCSLQPDESEASGWWNIQTD